MCFQCLKWKLVRKMYSKQGFTCTVSPSVYQQTSQITEKIDIQTWGDQTERPRCILDEAAVPTFLVEHWCLKYFHVRTLNLQIFQGISIVSHISEHIQNNDHSTSYIFSDQSKVCKHFHAPAHHRAQIRSSHLSGQKHQQQ